MMDGKPFGANGNSVVGVSDPPPPNVGPAEDSANSKYMEIEEPTPGDGTQEKSSGPKRRRKVRGILFLAILALAAIGFFFWPTGGSKKKIDLAVRDRSAEAERADTKKIDDVTAQAIAEVRATASPSPSPAVATSSSSTGVAGAGDPTLVTIPLGGTVAGVEGISTVGVSGPSSTDATAGASETQARRNAEVSIRCSPARKSAPASSKQNAAPAPSALPSTRPSAIEKKVPLPPFGALLPVRTLGAIYTLRSSLARFELTRDLRGDGWMMKKGTTLIGQQQGSQLDRAYVNLTGFIDPDSNKFVKLTGDTLGDDGAPGLKGKRKRLGSRWARVLSTAASAGVTLGQAALSRGGAIVNVSGAVTPEIQGLSQNVVNSREFVEVPAGSPAFVLVTVLPKEIAGADPEPAPEKEEPSLGDQELASLLTEGSPEQIKSALPRMTPELRKVAEAVLKESGNSKESVNSDATERPNQRKR